MDFPNNPVNGSSIRAGSQRYTAKNGVWEKNNGEIVVVANKGAIDLSRGTVHVLYLNGGSVTVNINNPLDSGIYDEFMIEVVASAATIVTWPESFKWDKGTPPVLPSSGRAIFAGYTRDGGTRYEMVTVSSDSKSSGTGSSDTGARIVKPSMTFPANGSVGVSTYPELASTPIQFVGMSATHIESEWEITGPDGVETFRSNIWNLTLYPRTFKAGYDYSVRVRYIIDRNAPNGKNYSEWSDPTNFSTVAAPPTGGGGVAA